MKIRFIALLILGIQTSSLFAASKSDINFELYNKDKTPITIKEIVVDGGSIKPDLTNKTIEKMKNIQAKIEPTGSNGLTIKIIIRHDVLDYTFRITPNKKSPRALLSFSTDKANGKELYPQTGKLMGILGKTESGLALRDNVDASGITVLTGSGTLAGKNKAQIKEMSASEKEAIRKAQEEKALLDSLPESVRQIAEQLKASSDEKAQDLYKKVLEDKAFRDNIAQINPSQKDTPKLIQFLDDLHQHGAATLLAQKDIKELFNPVFAGKWQELVAGDAGKISAWVAANSNRLKLFAQWLKEKEFRRSPIMSEEVILACLPNDFDRLYALSDFAQKTPNLDAAVFENFAKDIPATFKTANFAEAGKFYQFYLEKYRGNKNELSQFLGGLISNDYFLNNLQDKLQQLQEFLEFGFPFIKDPGYSAVAVGHVMALTMNELGDPANSIKKGTVYGWNISKEFKERFASDIFKDFLKTSAGTDYGKTELLFPYFSNLKASITKTHLAAIQEVGKFIKESTRAGFGFVDINNAIRSLPIALLNNKPTDVAAALGELGNSLKDKAKPIDADKIFKMIQTHPLKVGGAVLDVFLTELLPEKERNRAGSIRDGFGKLDAHAKSFAAIGEMQGALKQNGSLIKILLPVAVGDTDKAAQQLILLASSSIQAQLEGTPTTSGFTQLTDLANWIVLKVKEASKAQVEPEETNPFRDLPVSKEEVEKLRSKLKYIKYLRLVDNVIAKKATNFFLARSDDFKGLLKPNAQQSQKDVSKIIASMAPTLVAALPSIIEKFRVDKYLDFLLRVGEFQKNTLKEAEFKKEIWKFLKTVIEDINGITNALPKAFNVIRTLGASEP